MVDNAKTEEALRTLGQLLNDLSPTPDSLFPLCSVWGLLEEKDLLCPVVFTFATTLTRFPVDFEWMVHEHDAINTRHPELALPEPLPDLRPLPYLIDATQVAQERPTYAWYQRQIWWVGPRLHVDAASKSWRTWLMTVAFPLHPCVSSIAGTCTGSSSGTWRHSTMSSDEKRSVRWCRLAGGPWATRRASWPRRFMAEGQRADTRKGTPLCVASGSGQRLYHVTDTFGWTWPFGHSVVKDDVLLVIFRGTMMPGEWQTDFT